MSRKFENDEKDKSGEVSEETSSEKISQSIKKPSFWLDVLTTAAGIFIGLTIIDAAELNSLIENQILRVVINILLLTATILICKAVANLIRKAIKK